MSQRPAIAAITTVYHKFAHTQHIVDRFLEGYGWNGRHHHPPMDLVSLYVDQVNDNDLSRDRAERFLQMTLALTPSTTPSPLCHPTPQPAHTSFPALGLPEAAESIWTSFGLCTVEALKLRFVTAFCKSSVTWHI